MTHKLNALNRKKDSKLGQYQIFYRNAVWQVDYVIEKSSNKVDPLELPPLPAAELQKNLTFHNPRGVLYQVVDTPTGLVDYRMHFGLFVSVEVKSADFVHFSTALDHFWASKGSLMELKSKKLNDL